MLSTSTGYWSHSGCSIKRGPLAYTSVLHRHHPKLEELALANCGTVEKRDVLRQHLAALDSAELSTLVCRQLRCELVSAFPGRHQVSCSGTSYLGVPPHCWAQQAEPQDVL